VFGHGACVGAWRAASVAQADPCLLCQSLAAWEIRRSQHWRTIVNRNQNLLRKLCIVLQRHEESVDALESQEWSELHTEIRWAVDRLSAAFRPDHFNHVFLQNQDRHVHLHVRYATERSFEGREFHDPGYPTHYSLDTEQLIEPVFAKRLGRALASN
jgi:diadenosine tetraphosphate (Ap4A) HIT family hydrolase